MATYDGFLLAYFANGSHPDAEQIRFAVTPTPEVDTWLPLSGGRPILLSDVGEQGVRDPFLIRDERSGEFIVLATDLRTWPDDDWARAVRWGSRGIVVWRSDDLISWSGPELLDVAPANAGNAWAPKAYWFAPEQTWLIFFASALFQTEEQRGQGTYQRMLVTRTDDFRTVTDPAVYLDPGHDVIDATFLSWGQTVQGFSADSPTKDPLHQQAFVTQESGRDVLDPDFHVVRRDLGAGTQERAEGPATFTGVDGRTAYLMLDEFGLRGYQLYSSREPQAGRWTRVVAELPEGARHGSVISITAGERERLLAAYPA